MIELYCHQAPLEEKGGRKKEGIEEGRLRKKEVKEGRKERRNQGRKERRKEGKKEGKKELRKEC